MFILLFLKTIFSGLIPKLLQYWKIILPIVLLGVCWWYIHSLQNQRDEAKLNLSNYITQQKELVNKIETQNAIELQKRKEITNNIVVAYANSITSLKDYYEKHPNNKFITLPSSLLPKTISNSNATTTSGESTTESSTAPSGTTEVNTLNLEIAGEEVLQCQALIKWNKEQDLINNP